MKAFVFAALFLFISVKAKDVDPCTIKQPLPFRDIRLAKYIKPRGVQPICDRNVIKISPGDWYRSQEEMYNRPTANHACGTNNGIWLNGTIPIDDGKVHDRIACVPGLAGDCDKKYTVRIKNCGTYSVYFLSLPTTCGEGYCFGTGDGGLPPNISAPKPKVEYVNSTKSLNKKTKFDIIYFKCMVDSVSKTGGHYYYQVHWYVNNEEVEISDPVLKENFDSTNLHEGFSLTRLGVQISCAVKLKNTIKGIPGPISERSDNFFAGIKVLTTQPSVERNGEGKVEFLLTVPHPCLYYDVSDVTSEDCVLVLEMFTPNFEECKSKIAGKGLCGLAIRRSAWFAVHSFKIIHVPVQRYKIDKEIKLFFRTNEIEGTNLWTNVSLPEINVQITEENKKTKWKKSSCWARSDPHMYTFEGLRYDNQNKGTFIMYEYTDEDNNIMQVQTKVTHCYKSTTPAVYCVCGLAVRVAGDVFVINRCADNRFYPDFSFRSCKDNVIDARRLNERNYEIFLPTGTRITADLNEYQGIKMMNIYIYPTVLDYKRSLGLCGTLGNTSMRLRNSNEAVGLKLSNYDRFSLSWKVDEKENLLEMSNDKIEDLPQLTSSEILCTCPDKVGNSNNITRRANCSHSKIAECTRHRTIPLRKDDCFERTKRSFNSIKHNFKRSTFSYVPNDVIHSDIHLDNHNMHHLVKRSSSGHMTETQARRFCEQYMNESPGFQKCKNIPNVNSEDSISTCILDIQLTNSTSWSLVSREGTKTLCSKELQQNDTLSEKPKNGGMSLAEIIESVSCLNECSGHGNCNNGTCDCTGTYAAADCSIDLTQPPNVVGLNTEDGGLCDKTSCSKAIVQGGYFLDRSELSCKMERFEVSKDGNVSFHETSVIQAEYNTLSDIRCPFPSQRKKRETLKESFVIGYKVSVSNNANNFSKPHLIYVLDSTCQDTLNMSGSLRFILKDGYCFIRGQCVYSGTQDGSNICNICNYKANAFGWTKQSLRKECKDEEASYLWVIGVVLGIVAILISAFLVICWLKKKRERIIDPLPPPPYEMRNEKGPSHHVQK